MTIYLISTIFFIFFVFAINKISLIFKFFDKKELILNKKEIPMIGGLIIFLSLFFLLIFMKSFNIYFGIIIFSSLFIVLGIFDDIFEIHPFLRIGIQIFLIFLSLILLKDYYFTSSNIIFFLNLKSLLFAFILLFILTSINAFNFIDGSDGLSSSIVISSILSFLFIFSDLNLYTNYVFYSVFILILLYFILFNFGLFNIKIYLGNSGSIFLGFIIPTLFILEISNEFTKLFFPILFNIFLPFFNIISVVLLRLINKKNIFEPDFLHIHHILSFYGFSSVIILLAINFFVIIINFLFYQFHNYFGNFYSVIFSMSLFLIFFIIHFCLTRNQRFKTYHKIV